MTTMRVSVPDAYRPGREDHTHALRVAASLAIPGVVLLAIGRPELLVYAVFGSFAGMYGRTDRGRTRTLAQLRGGALLCAGMVIGVTLSQAHAAGWILVIVETTFAGAASLLADRWRLRPAGPFFAIFALGATALVPASTVRPEIAIALGAGTALLAAAIGRIGRRTDTSPVSGHPAPAVGREQVQAARVHALRYLLAVGGAGSIGLLFGFAHANWAMAAAAVPLAAIESGSVSSTELRMVLRRAGHRIAGTLVGLAVTAALVPLHLGSTGLVALILLLIFPTELFMTRHYALAIGFFTPLIMLLSELETPADPARMIVERTLDTLLGVAVGVTVAVVVRGPRRAPTVHVVDIAR